MTDRRILRAVVPVDDTWHPREVRGEIVHVGTRKENAVEFWWLDDPAAVAERRVFQVVGTGEPLTPKLTRHVGSAITPSGRYVWHLMEFERGDGDG